MDPLLCRAGLNFNLAGSFRSETDFFFRPRVPAPPAAGTGWGARPHRWPFELVHRGRGQCSLVVTDYFFRAFFSKICFKTDFSYLFSYLGVYPSFIITILKQQYYS